MTERIEVPTGAVQLSDVLDAAEQQGFDEEFRIADDPSGESWVHCPSCGADVDAATMSRAWSHRLEGVSDPADMLHVSALNCPNCGVGGVFVSPFGPRASAREAAVLVSLPEADHHRS